MMGSSSKEREKKEAAENRDDSYAPVHKPDSEREINNAGRGRRRHGVPYAFASAAYGRAGVTVAVEGGGRGSIRTGTEREAVHAQPPGRAHLVCASRIRLGADEGEGEARETAINTALRVRVSRSLHGIDDRSTAAS